MKVFAVILALTSFVLLAYGSPVAQPGTLQGGPSVENDGAAITGVVNEDEHVRLGRATCDLLSVSTPWGSANHSICAAHCLAMRKGFRGGRCIDGVCHCRK